MRYLVLNNLTIDTHNQILICADETITLAPKVYDLLIFFCQNPQRVISKDELMDKVWAGTLVTENAISRTLVKVRKALGDDPKRPQYIVTVPRKGYRMAVEFTAADKIEPFKKTQTAIAANQLTSNYKEEPTSDGQLWGKSFAYKAILLTIVILITSILFYSISSQRAENITPKKLTPLTREVAIEQHPKVSPDLSQLAYTKQQPGKPSYINIENLTSHEKMSISHIRGKLSRPVWSPNGERLAFLYQHNNVCAIFLAELNQIKDSDSWRRITECSRESWPHFVFSPNGEYLYFNDRLSQTNGYQIFRVDLANMQKGIVNQPITRGQGNYSFDISADGRRLVMLNSEFAPQTRIYTLAIDEAKLTQTAELPYLMRSVIWHHDNQTLVHPSPHPAYEIWQSTLAGDKLAVVASNTSRVKQISRINNGEDFSFVSYLLNRDIFYQVKGQKENEATAAVPLDNSSVMDYLPTLANKSKQYAFVSKRSTTAEVYLAEIPEDNRQQKVSKRLTFFNNPVKLYHLAFSPNDSQLAILADNQVFIADIKHDKVQQLPLDNIAISGLSWQNEQTLLFSTIRNNMWYFSRYNISTQQHTILGTGLQGGIYSAMDNSYYAIEDKNLQVVKLAIADQIAFNSATATGLYCSAAFDNRKLNLVQSGDNIMCPSPTHNNQLAAYSISQPLQTQKVWFSHLVNGDFASDNKQVIYTNMTQSVSDIMKTSSQ